MSELRFECPKCQQPFEADAQAVRQGVRCPSCGHGFIPDKIKEELESIKRERESFETQIISKAIAQEAARIQQLAEMFVRTSKISFLLGIVCLVVSLLFDFEVIGEASEAKIYLLAALSSVAFGLALWLYLVGQIIHIRALLSKK
jgi:DNA-directed RNA polymerase subunit RPC12/RpoP